MRNLRGILLIYLRIRILEDFQTFIIYEWLPFRGVWLLIEDIAPDNLKSQPFMVIASGAISSIKSQTPIKGNHS